MVTLGVTGGIGSGKTSVCRILERLGARVFYADAEARRLMQTNEQLRADLTDAFGPEAFAPDGALNRAYLAERVFNRDDELKRLNALVHPRVFDAFEAEKERAERDGTSLLVKEAALIFESGSDRQLDFVAVVDAPLDERIRRVAERDEVPAEQVMKRARHQLSAEELKRRADFIIHNDRDFAYLESQVSDLFHNLCAGQPAGR